MKLSIEYDIKENVNTIFDFARYALSLKEKEICTIYVNKFSSFDLDAIRDLVKAVFARFMDGNTNPIISIRQDENDKNIYHCKYIGVGSDGSYLEITPIKIDMSADYSVYMQDAIVNFVYNEVKVFRKEQ